MDEAMSDAIGYVLLVSTAGILGAILFGWIKKKITNLRGRKEIKEDE